MRPDLRGRLVLLVEDNPSLSSSLAKGLREDGLAVETYATAEPAIACAGRIDVAGIVLDLGLPDRDGLDVLHAWRRAGCAFPILVLTARSEVVERVAALDAGADDYVIKPFVYAELAARLFGMMRRAEGPRWAPQSFAGVGFRADELVVRVRGEAVALTPPEHVLLGYLLRRRGDTVSRFDLLAELGHPPDSGSNVVNVHVSRLRKKIGTSAVVIDTVRGAGYRLRAAETTDA